MQYKWVYYQMRFVIFQGDALLDPNTVTIGWATSESNAQMIVDALNEVSK
jgi:hypothetical protein